MSRFYIKIFGLRVFRPQSRFYAILYLAECVGTEAVLAELKRIGVELALGFDLRCRSHSCPNRQHVRGTRPTVAQLPAAAWCAPRHFA